MKSVRAPQTTARGGYVWYKLAAPNGLSGDEPLAEGRILSIPPGVIRSTYNVNTFTPYDPAEAIGYQVPKPPKPREVGCGGFGALLVAVLAIAIMVALHVPMINLFSGAGFTGGAISTSATALSYVAGGALRAQLLRLEAKPSASLQASKTNSAGTQ